MMSTHHEVVRLSPRLSATGVAVAIVSAHNPEGLSNGQVTMRPTSRGANT